jgi:hypothetical protein
VISAALAPAADSTSCERVVAGAPINKTVKQMAAAWNDLLQAAFMMFLLSYGMTRK